MVLGFGCPRHDGGKVRSLISRLCVGSRRPSRSRICMSVYFLRLGGCVEENVHVISQDHAGTLLGSYGPWGSYCEYIHFTYAFCMGICVCVCVRGGPSFTLLR